MAELDRGEGNGNGYAGKVVVGLLAGAALGAGLGLLFAPKAGSQLRRQIGERASRLANTTSTTYRRASERAGAGWKTARRFYDKGREATAMRG